MPKTKINYNQLNQNLLNGWIQAVGSWTYASANTINVPSGAASLYQIGDMIKITQTTDKYFYVSAVSDTLLTVRAGADYTVANASITNPYYAHGGNPLGFPGSFSLGTPTWTTSGIAFTNQPQNNTWYFYMVGKTVHIGGFAATHATSGGTGRFIATFGAGYLPPFSVTIPGSAVNISNSTVYGHCWPVTGASVQIIIAKYDASAIASNSEYFCASCCYKI